MADFRTHLSVAVSGGALLAVSGWQAALWSPVDGASLAALTAFGGILPDVDSDHSHSIRLIFNLVALLAVVAGVLWLQSRLNLAGLLVACGGLYLGVRFGVGAVFRRFTVHRGIWHSLLATGLCGLGITTLSYQWLAQDAWQAWSQGLALMLGGMIHLLLDEVYSVDLAGSRLKRSFGTALKLFDYREPGNSLVMLMLAAGLAPWLPPWQALAELVSQGARLWH
ncbi:metal-dependent hydrolase [Halomonas sp. HP20-15]|uniref:metal-dependent hydrolase n=1 Tax=Halomonas sp. HP20-15 TaxID=3085901 RepID=UPI002982524A|nr:metal-dependent hydrolase [Halomonas sp. HP20-15]MDW5378547.1 metal-dependent hydrolase [Halomonas sp. HP20-15]